MLSWPTIRRHSIDCIKSIELKKNHFFGSSKMRYFLFYIFFKKKLSVQTYNFWGLSLYKYILYRTKKSYRIIDLFDNLYKIPGLH